MKYYFILEMYVECIVVCSITGSFMLKILTLAAAPTQAVAAPQWAQVLPNET